MTKKNLNCYLLFISQWNNIKIVRGSECFFPFSKIVKSDVLSQDLICRLLVRVNGISIHQNLRLCVDNQKQIKFLKI